MIRTFDHINNEIAEIEKLGLMNESVKQKIIELQ